MTDLLRNLVLVYMYMCVNCVMECLGFELVCGENMLS